MTPQTCACCGLPVSDPNEVQIATMVAFARLGPDLMFAASINHDETVNLTVDHEPGSILIYRDGSFDKLGLSGEQESWPARVPAPWTGRTE